MDLLDILALMSVFLRMFPFFKRWIQHVQADVTSPDEESCRLGFPKAVSLGFSSLQSSSFSAIFIEQGRRDDSDFAEACPLGTSLVRFDIILSTSDANTAAKLQKCVCDVLLNQHVCQLRPTLLRKRSPFRKRVSSSSLE